MSEFIPLVCPQCGGKIEIDKTNESFVSIDDSTFMFIGSGADEKITCLNCKTEFVRTQRFGVAPTVTSSVTQVAVGSNITQVAQTAFNQSGQTVKGAQVNVNTSGGDYIRGNINTRGGDFVGGKVIIIKK